MSNRVPDNDKGYREKLRRREQGAYLTLSHLHDLREPDYHVCKFELTVREDKGF